MDYGTKYIDIVKKIVLSNIDKKETCVFLFGGIRVTLPPFTSATLKIPEPQVFFH